MYQLPVSQQVHVIALLTEGMSIRAIARLTDVRWDTIMRLGARIGSACDRLHDQVMRNLQIPLLQLDETWAFIQKKQHQVQDHHPDEQGDCYLWLALDATTKVIISYHLGKRTAENAKTFVADLRARIINRPQITTDAFRPYVDAIEDAFGTEVDYVRINKRAGFVKDIMQGHPDLSAAHTAYIERCNLTIRMQLRRHARRTNAHSKTFRNHCAAVALHLAFYHWCRVHETLRVTPAMELGLTNHVWSVAELIDQAQAPQGSPLPPAFHSPPKLRVIQGGKRHTA